MEDELLVSLRNGVRIIKFNRPLKKNAINQSMYLRLTNLLKEDAENDAVVVVVLTGSGDFYSSGNDFKESFTSLNAENTDDALSSKLNTVRNLILAFLNFPKLLIAVVNGPAVGIAATTLGLCDIVYATENAWFETPFIKLGLCAEGCSSSTFLNIMGRSKASEMLFLGKRMNAQEAYSCGLVAKVIPSNQTNEFIETLLEYGKMPVETVKSTKKLILSNFQELLCECSLREAKELSTRFQSEDFSNAITKMFIRKQSKL